MTERDDELARALADLPVPDHAPGFWGRLDEALAERGRSIGAPGSETSPDQRRLRPVPSEADAVPSGDTVVATPARTGSGAPPPARSPWWLAAAAAAAVAVGGAAVAAGVLDRGDDGLTTVAVDPATTATTVPDAPAGPDAPATTAPPAPGLGEPAPPSTGVLPGGGVVPTAVGAVEDLGRGLVVGALAAADGSTTVLVQGPLPGDEQGCEGMPLEGLLVLAPDGSTRPVTAADGTPVVNGVQVHPAPAGGRVAVLSQCEGYLGQLLVGRVGADGVPVDLRPIAGTTGGGAAVDGAPEIEQVPSVAWTPDGERLLLATATFDGGGSTGAVWEHDLVSGGWAERTDAPAGTVAVLERADGSLVALTEDALVVGGEARERRDADGLALGPDGVTVAVHGAEGLLVLQPDGTSRSWYDVGAVPLVRFLPDGSGVAFSAVQEGDGSVLIAVAPIDPPADGASPDPIPLGRTTWGWFEVQPDGAALLVDVATEDEPTGSAPLLQRWTFVR